MIFCLISEGQSCINLRYNYTNERIQILIVEISKTAPPCQNLFYFRSISSLGINIFFDTASDNHLSRFFDKGSVGRCSPHIYLGELSTNISHIPAYFYPICFSGCFNNIVMLYNRLCSCILDRNLWRSLEKSSNFSDRDTIMDKFADSNLCMAISTQRLRSH